ncbi:ion channel [Stappia sp.]|jgi:voltage-gated potassium channel|uniref:ion channel n=1 Tax=Stappia sp. TaxID=1870903 RepID=UPI003A9A1422
MKDAQKTPPSPAPDTRVSPVRALLRELYHGNTTRARAWQIALIVFDLMTIGYFIVSSMISDPSHVDHRFDYALGAVLSLDLAFRLIAAARPARTLAEFTTIADAVVIASLFASAVLDNLAFLRVVRMLRLLRSYHLLRELRDQSGFFKRNEEVIQSGINLIVFIFVVTALVFVLEGHQNPAINTYLDALYFTVTTLTTTGFGDITMTDSTGRFMTIIIMVFGVGLFLRLVQTIFRPQKVQYACPDCGLSRHDPDAVHCKHCGRTLNIPTEGEI